MISTAAEAGLIDPKVYSNLILQSSIAMVKYPKVLQHLPLATCWSALSSHNFTLFSGLKITWAINSSVPRSPGSVICSDVMMSHKFFLTPLHILSALQSIALVPRELPSSKKTCASFHWTLSKCSALTSPHMDALCSLHPPLYLYSLLFIHSLLSYSFMESFSPGISIVISSFLVKLACLMSAFLPCCLLLLVYPPSSVQETLCLCLKQKTSQLSNLYFCLGLRDVLLWSTSFNKCLVG